MDTWTTPQGYPINPLITINDGSGNAIPYTGTETLGGAIWAGDNQYPLATLTPSWATPSAGTAYVPIPASATSGLAPGQYRVQVTVADGTGTHPAYEAVLVVAWSPGSTPIAPRPTYIDVTDLRAVCRWIEDLQDPEQSQAGFATECADARDWFDECCLRNYTGGFVSLMGYHDLALNAWFGGGARKTVAGNIWLKEQLAANNLIVAPRIKRVNALYAVSQILQQNLNKSKDYLRLAAMYRHQCYQLLVSTTAEIDVTGQGLTPNIPITFSQANTLFT
jgi:hypothetical protein